MAAMVASDLFDARQQMALSLGWHIVLACTGIGFPGGPIGAPTPGEDHA